MNVVIVVLGVLHKIITFSDFITPLMVFHCLYLSLVYDNLFEVVIWTSHVPTVFGS